MVLAREKVGFGQTIAKAPSCKRNACRKPLAERHCADIIELPKRVPVCEVFEKERKWAVCGEGKVPAKEIYIREMERVLLSLGKEDPKLGVVVLRADKKSLNALNKTGGKHGAGDSCLSLYMESLEHAVRLAYPFAKRTYLVRDSDSSDETFIVIAGNADMLKQACIGFAQVYEKVVHRSMDSLHRFAYTENKLIEEEGFLQVQPLSLDLARFSRALRSPDIVARAHLSGPRLIQNKDLCPGFISQALEELGKKDAVKPGILPPSFSPVFIAKPGLSPYIRELPVSGFLCPGSVALEMKFMHAQESDKWAAYRLLDKTGKGIAETLSGRFGLRYINTFMGEASADHMINATALAMKDLETETRCRVMRTDSKLMYIVEGMDPDALILKIQELAKLRIGPVMGSHTIPFIPSPRAILAGSLHSNDLRAHLALDALGLDHPTEALTYLDLMVSSAKELRPEILSAAINQSEKNPDFTVAASSAFSTICGLIYQNPAIRDAEDLVYSVRSGLMVSGKGAEERIWDFARKWGKELRNRLLEVFEEL